MFAAISSSSTAAGTPTFGFSAASGTLAVTAGSSVQTTVSVAPTNGFAGTVTLACSGLPVAATCAFSPAQFTATASAPATGTVTIQTAMNTALLQPHFHDATVITTALLLPFASILAFYRRRLPASTSQLRLLSLLGILFLSVGLIAGCSNSYTPPVPFTPAGTSQVTITATSGSITQSTVVALTVQ